MKAQHCTDSFGAQWRIKIVPYVVVYFFIYSNFFKLYLYIWLTRKIYCKMKLYVLKVLVVFALFVTSLGKEAEEKNENEKKEAKPEIGNVIGIDLGTTYSW